MLQDETMNRATSTYIDNLYINEDIPAAAPVKEYFARFDLTCKYPEPSLENDVQVLSLQVWGEHSKPQWKCHSRNSQFHHMMEWLVRRKLLEYFPVCRCLHMITAFVKHRVNMMVYGWGDVTDDPMWRPCWKMRIRKSKPVQGAWVPMRLMSGLMWIS